MSLSISERDLRHDADPARLDGAMMKCQGWAPTCADMGMCHQSGGCFSGASCASRREPAAPLVADRIRRIH